MSENEIASENLYDELIAMCSERFNNFFKNVKTFDNQFSFSDFNRKCYEKMYSENEKAQIKPVKAIKEEIPELKDCCRKCANFYIPARNKSIPKYDVLLGREPEESLIDFLNKKTSFHTERGDLENRSLPDLKITNKNGETLARIEVKFHGAPFVFAYNFIGRYCYEGSATLDYEKIEKQINLIKDEKVPLFYVHWIEYPCLKGIFYETKEQIEEYLKEYLVTFDRKEREGDKEKNKKSIYLKKIYSPLLEMNDFDSLVKTINALGTN